VSTLDSKLPTQNSAPDDGRKDPSGPNERSWRGLYALVLGELIVLIVLFYVFTKVFE
jgi:hypothetical protein